MQRMMNGTPRQPLLVPLAKACLMFDRSRVPQASLDGLEGYSHCWIIYVFHLNTDLEKLWRHPSRSKLKAKVRVPRLEGERIGIFATRTPHRPCPIGLTVAKVEDVRGHKVMLSGVDLVNGTPVLDVKPYLPYCDSIEGATVPDWVKGDNILAVSSVNFSPRFSCSLDRCWLTRDKNSLYSSPEEFQGLIKQVLSWDIRSVSQRSRPHNSQSDGGPGVSLDDGSKLEKDHDDEIPDNTNQQSLPCNIMYHLILEDFKISYKIDSDGNVLVEEICLSSSTQSREVTAAA
ncbi:hypothetical protein Leryth_009456 [Lithospermum erythrorhizon]|nr:hypothetical protein Leryth_009456 [Lithospermum erythrorhizon]